MVQQIQGVGILSFRFTDLEIYNRYTCNEKRIRKSKRKEPHIVSSAENGFLTQLCLTSSHYTSKQNTKLSEYIYNPLPTSPNRMILFNSIRSAHIHPLGVKQYLVICLVKHNTALSSPAHLCLHQQSCQSACHLWWTRMSALHEFPTLMLHPAQIQ